MPDTATATGGARLAEIRARQSAIRERHATLQAELVVLGDVEGDMDESQRSAWDDGNTEFDGLMTEHADLDDEAEPLQARQDRAVAIRDSNLVGGRTATETGDGAAGVAQTRSAHFNIGHTGTTDIYDRSSLSVHNEADGNSYRDRASFAIDSWRSANPEWKASAQKLVDNADASKRDRQIAEHILTFGNPLYTRAFSTFFQHGDKAFGFMDRDQAQYFAEANQRAVNEGSISAGQAIVPPYLDPTIILTNAGTVSPFRQLADVRTITTQVWKGVTSAGVTAEWTAEASEVTDASPTFTQPSITPVRGDAYVEASFEALEDTDLANEVAMLFGDAKDRLEGTSFAVGTGSTQPFGVVTRLAVTTASKTATNTNGSIGVVDIFNLDNNLPPRFRTNASFIGARGILNLVRQLATGPSQQQAAFWTDFGGALPSKLIGYPVHEASGMLNSLSTATASNDSVLVLGDFKAGYKIIDRVGTSISYNGSVIGPNRRPIGSVGWAVFWRTGADVVNPAALQILIA